MFKGKRSRRKTSVRTIVHLFHGVQVIPGQAACEAVRSLDGKRLLSEDAPMLPLTDCPQATQCTCRYRHFQDRRTDNRRDEDDGLPPRHVENDRRSRCGRRVTDG